MTPPPTRRPLRGDGRLLLGVGAGLARRWELEPRIVRIALAFTLAPLGAGLLVYAALALVMPADGASDADAGWREEVGRSIAEALVVLGAVLAIAVVGVVAAGLAAFGLAPAVLLVATAALAGVIFIDHERAWLLGAAALALAVPAAGVVLTDTSVARQVGDVHITITGQQDVAADGYRVGLGSLLLDLRDFDADEGTSTLIRARADVRPIVVALPPSRCFNLEIRYALHRSWLTGSLLDARRDAFYATSARGYPQRHSESGNDRLATGALIAFGKATGRGAGHYVRPAVNPAAPTLRLELQSARSQVYVRDYPASLDPLAAKHWPQDGRAPTPLARIQARLSRATRPTPRSRPGTMIQVDPANGAITVRGRRATGAVTDALSDMRDRAVYPYTQARKLAGACAAPSEVRSIRRRLQRTQRAELRTFKAGPRHLHRSTVIDLERLVAGHSSARPDPTATLTAASAAAARNPREASAAR